MSAEYCKARVPRELEKSTPGMKFLGKPEMDSKASMAKPDMKTKLSTGKNKKK